MDLLPDAVVQFCLTRFLSSEDANALGCTGRRMSMLRWYHHVGREFIDKGGSPSRHWRYGEMEMLCMEMLSTTLRHEATWYTELPWIIQQANNPERARRTHSPLCAVPAHMLLREIRAEQEREPAWFETVD